MFEASTVLRVARPSDDLDALLGFYCGGLGLDLRLRFENHLGFDGVVLGHALWPYHLEFTHCRGHKVGRAPGPDHLIAFYIPDRAAWARAVDRMAAAGHFPVAAFNPYWDQSGATFEDPDGYRIVLQNECWNV